MNIAHVSTATGWRGGEQQCLYLARGLAARGITSTVIAPPDTPLLQKAAEAGLATRAFAFRGEWDVPALWRFGALLKELNADIVHAHDAHAVTLAAVGGWRAGCRRVATRRVDFALKGGWKYRRMDRVVAISNAVRAVCMKAGLPEAALPVVYSGVDPDRFSHLTRKKEYREELGIGRKTDVILNVAALTDHKGQEYLLQAFQTVLLRRPDTKLLIAGTGELEADLKHLAEQLAIADKVAFLGFRDDVGLLYDLCDVFAMSSHLEGLCTAVLDAMAMERAAVVTAAGGLPELVEDGRTGRVVPARDPAALADALSELLDDYKKRTRMGAAARQRLLKHFTVDAMVDGNVRVYRELLGSQSSS